MTNPSKGLLPQLVEVLGALTDSQQLLTNRIHTAHLELLAVHSTDGAGSRRTTTLDPGEPAEIQQVVTDPISARDLRELFFPDSMESSIEQSRAGSDSNSNPTVLGDSNCSNDLEAVTHPVAPTETAKPVHQGDVSQHAAPTEPDDVWNTRRHDAALGRGDRSYNFFDELDTRLADLGNSENGHEEIGS